MTISNTTLRTSATGAGSALAIPYTFATVASGDLLVIERVTATGVETELTENASSDGYTATYSSTGGTVTTSDSIASTSTVHVIQNLTRTQTLDLTQGGSFNAENIESALDKNNKIANENRDRIDRSIQFPDTDPSDSIATLPNSIDRASKTLGFDSAGAPTSLTEVTSGSVSFSTIGTNIAEAANANAVVTLLQSTSSTTKTGDIVTRSPYFDVRSFGAAVNGTTNDAVAVQAALDAAAVSGGTVLIPGTCAVGSSSWVGLVLTSKDNVTIMGRSLGDGFKLLFAPTQFLTSNGAFSLSWFKFDTCTRIIMKGLTFDTNSVDANVIGLESSDDCSIIDNYIDGTTGTDLAFVMAEGCSRNRYERNTIVGTYHALILGRSGNAGTLENYSTVADNICKDQVNAGISIMGTYSDVINNKIIDCGQNALSMGTGTDSSPTIPIGVRIIGNIITDAAAQGINFESNAVSQDERELIDISHNIINGCNGSGILVYQSVNTIISNNISRNNTVGIMLKPRTGATTVGDNQRINIIGNNCYDSRSGGSRTQINGIRIETGSTIASDLSDIVVSNNICNNHTNNGIICAIVASPAGTGSGLNITGNICNDNAFWGITVNGVWADGIVANNLTKDNDTAAGGRGDINISSSVNAGVIRLSNNKTGVGSADYNIASVQLVDGYLDIDNANAATSGTGEDNLQTTVIPANMMSLKGGIKIRAAGTISGANDTKVIKFYFGTSSITMVSAAAGDTTDWQLEIEIWNTATNAQRIVWRGLESDDTALSGYDTDNEDTTAAVTIKLTGECANGSDTITQTMWLVEAIERTDSGP